MSLRDIINYNLSERCVFFSSIQIERNYIPFFSWSCGCWSPSTLRLVRALSPCPHLVHIAIGAIIIFVSPARIAQTIYNKADLLASSRYGWSILGTSIGTWSLRFSDCFSSRPISVIVSFPPAIGHTTLCTLAGFAYGLNGFFIGGIASLIGSALSFTVLRLLFKKRLHSWSSKNEKWQALESVVVCETYMT